MVALWAPSCQSSYQRGRYGGMLGKAVSTSSARLCKGAFEAERPTVSRGPRRLGSALSLPGDQKTNQDGHGRHHDKTQGAPSPIILSHRH